MFGLHLGSVAYFDGWLKEWRITVGAYRDAGAYSPELAEIPRE